MKFGEPESGKYFSGNSDDHVGPIDPKTRQEIERDMETVGFYLTVGSVCLITLVIIIKLAFF